MKKKWTRALAILCTLALALTLMVPVFAEDAPGTDSALPENAAQAETEASQEGEVPAAEQDVEPAAEQDVEPAAEQDAEPAAEQDIEPAAEQDAEPVEEASAGGEITPEDAAQPAEEVGTAEPTEETTAEPMPRGITDADGFTQGNPPSGDYWWKLDEDGTLTIKGETMVGDWTSGGSSSPWDSQRSAIKSVVIEEGMSNVGGYAFKACTNLTSVTIPSSVTSIGDNAFYGCRGLTGSLPLPEGVTSIGSGAFRGCSGLTGSLTIPESVTSISDRAFQDCSGLTGSLTIPEGVTSIGDSAFEGCSGLTGSLTIPEGVTSIGGRAFYECSGLTGSLTIPEGVTSIGSAAFQGCSGLTGSLMIPEGVTSIGSSAFFGCRGLTSVTIPFSVTSIGNFAFCDCTGFASATIAEGVTSFGENAFSGCTSMTSITIPSSVTSIGEYAFSGCRELTSVTIPEGVTSIEPGTFAGCSGLTGVTIPEGVTSIGKRAFSSCNGLTSVTISSSVTSIGNEAFSMSKSNRLRKVCFVGNAPEIARDAFNWADATGYYPQNNATWTEEVRYQYNVMFSPNFGHLEWVAYDPANPPDMSPEEPIVPDEPDTPAEPAEPETPTQPDQPVEPDTPAQPDQPVQPAEPEIPAATPGQIAGDLADQVIASGGNYDLARQLLESVLNNKGILVDARITEAMRLAIQAAGSVDRAYRVTDSIYVYASYPQSFAEALQFARAEVNAAGNAFVLDMGFPEGKQSPLGVYITVYLKEAFNPSLEYRWYCDDGSYGIANVAACDANGYKTCATFYAPHFSTYTILPAGGENPFAPTAPAEAPVLKSTGGDVSHTMDIVLVLAAAAVLGCVPMVRKKKKTR